MSEDGAGGRRSRVLQAGIVIAIVAGFVVLSRVLPNIDIRT